MKYPICLPTWQEAIAAQSFYEPIRTLQSGDLEMGFKQADRVVEGRTVSVMSESDSR